jgi:hypothetical protein
MPRSTKWIGIAVFGIAVFIAIAASAFNPPDPKSSPKLQNVTVVPADFALIARVPAKESGALETLLAKEVLPSIGKSQLVRDVSTYSARDGDNMIYTVQIRLRKPGSHSTNIAFEVLANGRSFEDARALQAKVKKYFAVSPILAEKRNDLSINRSFAIRVAKAPEEK